MHLLLAALFLAGSAQLTTIEIDAWPGQRFVILDEPAKSRQYGYQSFRPPLPYAEWVGKIVTVTSVTAGSPATIVKFKTADGKELEAEAYVGKIDYLGPLRDVESARERWRGKTLHIRGAEILTFDRATEKFGSIKLGKGARVTVKDVVAGMFEYEPVRFLLVADDGREGFVDVQMSGTNVSKVMRGTDTFDELFSE